MGIVTYVWQNRCHDRHETMSMLRLLYNGNFETNYLTFEGGDGGGGGGVKIGQCKKFFPHYKKGRVFYSRRAVHDIELIKHEFFVLRQVAAGFFFFKICQHPPPPPPPPHPFSKVKQETQEILSSVLLTHAGEQTEHNLAPERNRNTTTSC